MWELSGNELTHNSREDIRPQSSQLAEPLWTDPGLESGVSVHKLISTLKKKEKKQKEVQVGNELLNILPKSSHTRKKPPPQWRDQLFSWVSGLSVLYNGLISCSL